MYRCDLYAMLYPRSSDGSLPAAACVACSGLRHVTHASIDDGTRSMHVSAYRRSGNEAFLVVGSACVNMCGRAGGAVVHGAMVVNYTCGDSSSFVLQSGHRSFHAIPP